MRQMEPHVKWHFSGRKSYFRFLMFQNGSKDQYLGFQRISRKSVKVELLTYHVTRPIIELKLANFKTCSDSFNMGINTEQKRPKFKFKYKIVFVAKLYLNLNLGRFCSVLMPVVTLQSFKVIGCLKVS